MTSSASCVEIADDWIWIYAWPSVALLVWHLFGRAQEEIDALQEAGVAVEIVPGITAALAACAELKISFTQRGVSRHVALVTPRIGDGKHPSEWLRTVCNADSSAIYMAAGQAETLATSLIAAGLARETAVRIVENVSLPDSRQLHTTLAGLPAAARHLGAGPAIILLGAAFARPDAMTFSIDTVTPARAAGA